MLAVIGGVAVAYLVGRHCVESRPEMPTPQTERNKTISRHFTDAMNTNNPEIISRTIDELVEPDAVIRTPSPIDVTGASAWA
jgi:hypothetical protein